MRDDLRTRLVTANHILANEGIIEGFGHVSVRDPESGDVLISAAKSPGLVEAGDVMRLSTDGEVLEGEPDDVYKEAVIHTAIYRAREDVNAVVHHHAPEIMPYTVSDVELRPVFRMAALFHAGVPTFREYDPEYGLLITNREEADRMAATLGDCRAQLLEAHGANVVGEGLKPAVLGTVYLVMNARYQAWAELFGSPRYYTGPEESIRTMIEDVILSESSMDRMWAYLQRQLPDRSERTA
ncbi:MAG: class II aldolase/adducin family protein [Haloferacaceae archaeon]